MIVLGLWVLTWSILMAEGFIRYTEFSIGVTAFAVFCLVLSFPMLLLFGVAAGIGRWIAEIRPLRPYKYWIMFIPPLVLAVLALFPAAVGRLNPEHEFETLSGMELPQEARIVGYRRPYQGIDGAVHFEIRCPPAEQRMIRNRLGRKTGTGKWANVTSDVDPKSGNLSVVYAWY